MEQGIGIYLVWDTASFGCLLPCAVLVPKTRQAYTPLFYHLALVGCGEGRSLCSHLPSFFK